ncbi:MAG: HAMP domain-containing sensor histidine kinase [Leeuwenhoekiella sp.]|uniref:sensor histidine kinase n=1 Tax=Leeuwenhoekiella sp. TaxID=1977054 RepID=UPI003242E4B2
MIKNKKGYIIIFMIAVLGLFVVQIQFLRIGLNLARVQFDQQIKDAGTSIQQDLRERNQLTFLLEQALLQDNSYFKTTPDSLTDASRHFFNDFIRHRLTENGITAAYSYRLFTRDSTYYLSSPNSLPSTTEAQTYPFKIEGFLVDALNKPLILELQFENLSDYFFFQLNGLTIPALLFMITIILTVIWVLRSFYWQRNVITTTNAFINNLTHELKTPVFSIGLASKMLYERVADRDRPLVQTIRTQTDRLKVHIENVLELAQLEEKKRLIRLEPVDFKPNLEALCASFEAIASLETTPFTYQLQEGSYPILAEAGHLENAVNNLLDNALKYGLGKPIHLVAYKSKRYLEICITDQGMGVSKAERPKIFKKYYRGSAVLTSKSGYGLGLTYVQQIIKKHKGRLNFESKPNSGTTVTLKIPLQR